LPRSTSYPEFLRPTCFIAVLKRLYGVLFLRQTLNLFPTKRVYILLAYTGHVQYNYASAEISKNKPTNVMTASSVDAYDLVQKQQIVCTVTVPTLYSTSTSDGTPSCWKI